METGDKTVTVVQQGQRVAAYAEYDGTVYVYDDVAGHYSLHHGLSAGQVRFVRARATRPTPDSDLERCRARGVADGVPCTCAGSTSAPCPRHWQG